MLVMQKMIMVYQKIGQPKYRRSAFSRIIFYAVALSGIAVLIALGCWQMERLAWKTNLINTVNARISAVADPAPGPKEWPLISSEHDAYRHITISGVLLNDKETLVHASTIHGTGYWLITPLRTDEGFTVLINRGFVPRDHRASATRAESQITTKITVTGLLRITEPGGSLLQSNNPKLQHWYSRDVAAISAVRQLPKNAPYFIDADATPNPGGLPIGGLTVVNFYNHHLQYAITWFTLAAMLSFYVLLAAFKPPGIYG